MIDKKLSIVIPCYNEEQTLASCIDRVVSALRDFIHLEIVIVDDCSKDNSYAIAQDLCKQYPLITVSKHDVNQGKGAALRTGFQSATGDYVAVQDADMEYDPHDLRKLVMPLVDGSADVVLGSRFLTTQEHSVNYFWHTMGNKFLTLLSNMFTDLYLTDMETCYKVFKREVIQSVEIKENRFGFEPEIVAKIAHHDYRIYEIGISYHGRTYDEGKKIGWKDGFRALYCIMHYNAHQLPLPVQFLMYLFIGGFSAVCNILIFTLLINYHASIPVAALTAFFSAAVVNYFLCIHFLFRHEAHWKSKYELIAYLLLVSCIGVMDMEITRYLSPLYDPVHAKIIATLCSFVFNFLGRKFIIFREKKSTSTLKEIEGS
jgi:dolichol-phosphate mannosyltransferase